MFHVACSKDMEEYFSHILTDVKKIYKIAEECRKKGFDVTENVEIPLAKDMADRVEGIVGPDGVAERIRELVSEMGKEPAALEIAKEIVEGKFGSFDREMAAEQAVRTALAVITEGIVAAPLEGIAHVKIKKNKDGSEYLAIYFAGPIRSAGGTAQALAVLVGDYVRKNMGLNRYMPTEDEIERYVEEVDLYQSEVGSFQYSPKAEEIRTAVKNISVEITGEATDDVEVSGHRDLDRVETNQIRGGALLALVEGVLLKAPKILRHVDKLGIEGWDWLKELKNKKEEGREKKEEEENEEEYIYEDDSSDYEDIEIEAITKFIGEVIAGRPVFAHPSKKGGFRLRYGRSRNTGFATDGFHPALMYLVDDFMAVGTQLKTERPGKATCVVPVDSIEPPIVKLKNGSVIKIDTVEKALEYRGLVDEILFLGDILVNFGDFLENNHPLLPSSWCEEWYEKILISKNIPYDKEFINNPTPKDAVNYALKTKTPLHPKYTYRWHDVSKDDVLQLRDWVLSGNYDEENNAWIIPYDVQNEAHKTAKRVLELIGCCHKVNGETKTVEVEEYPTLLYSLGYDIENNKDLVDNIDEAYSKAKNSMHLINLLAPFEIKRNTYVYVGARMGRPEKAAERKMKPPVNGLFPIGNAGSQVRLINKAVEEGKTDDVEVSYGKCPHCERISLYRKCPFCGAPVKLTGPSRITIPLKDYWYKTLENLSINKPGDVKCIKGMTSKEKVVEPLEKAILRAMNNIYVFKDGTTRFDCTDVPVTHFKPNEVNASIDKLIELGYNTDIHGNPLEDGEQILELKPQDVIIPEKCAKYFVNVAKFIDDLLEKYYGKERFYNVTKEEDLIGHLVIGMAPHTSAGMVGRIIGYSKASVGYAHPYFHASKRRNCFPPNTEILVNIDGETKRITLKELYEELFDGEVYEKDTYIKKKPKQNVNVYSFDTENNKVVLTDIEEVMRIPSPEHLVKINLETGREFITTHNHPALVYENGKFIKKLALDVKEGDLILLPKIEFEEADIEEIDLLKEFAKDEFREFWDIIRVRGIRNWIKNNDVNRKLIRELKLNDYLRHNSIPLNLLLEILKRSNLTLDEVPKDCYVAVRRDRVNIKRIVKIGPLLKVIGYYLSEGYARESKSVYHLNFSNSEEEIREDIKKSIREVFGDVKIYENEKEGKLTLSSRIVYLFVTKILKIGENAKSKRVPSFVFKLPKDKVKLMLSTYFAGDGSAIKTTPRVSVYSANKSLLRDIDLLLNRYGIKTYWTVDKNANEREGSVVKKYYENKDKDTPKSIVYALNITGYYYERFFKEIGFSVKRKQEICNLHKDTNWLIDETDWEFGWLVKVRQVEKIKSENDFVYSLNAKYFHNVIIGENILTSQCDGDEDAFFLLLDAFINFSKKFLPDKRGGQMDAPLVLTTILDPKEVDGEVHNMDAVWEYPLEFYEKTIEMVSPKEVKELIQTIEDRLGKPSQYEGIGYTHGTSRIDEGPLVCAYKTLGSMLEKTSAQLYVAKKIRATNERDVAEKVIQSHFVPDLIGNLRAFSRQSVRCKCGAKYRRIPLKGVCKKCGSKLILTVSKGAVEKYMEVSQTMAEKYNASNYIKQRLDLIKDGIDSLFKNDKRKQVKIEDFFK